MFEPSVRRRDSFSFLYFYVNKILRCGAFYDLTDIVIVEVLETPLLGAECCLASHALDVKHSLNRSWPEAEQFATPPGARKQKQCLPNGNAATLKTKAAAARTVKRTAP